MICICECKQWHFSCKLHMYEKENLKCVGLLQLGTSAYEKVLLLHNLHIQL
jgi:hypothetical protein